MLTQQKLIVSLALILFTVCASASPIVYVLNGKGQFGTVDLGTGAFRQIGPDMPEGSDGLVQGPKGSLLTLTVSGNLDSINPATGVTTVVGPTGLGDCTSPASPCAPNSANGLVGFGGSFYATDLTNNLYSVNPLTGAATLRGPTGIPPLPFVLLSTNPDGSTNLFNETLFGAGGKLYATFDAFTIDFATFTKKTVIPDALYQIDPTTGLAMFIAPTALNLSAAIDVSGTTYAFNAAKKQVVTLNLTNGNTSFVSNLDPTAGLISGAAAVPEPASIALAGIGIAAIVVCRRRRSLSKHVSGYLLTLSFALCAISSAFGQGPAFTTIDYPGATATQPLTINSRGNIGGFYTIADKTTHGFVLIGGQYTAIDFPGATSTFVSGINPQGDIVGYFDFADNIDHGFLLSGGQFTKIDFPGAVRTGTSAINSRGDIVGYYQGEAKLNRGYLLSGGQYSAIDFPGATQGSTSAVNPQGDIAGTYMSGGVVHGYFLSEGDFTSWDFPGSTYTNTTGINARGDIVGRYNAAGVTHGYLLSGGRFSTFDFPGATFTGATGINQRGDILGRYYNADGVFHGFLMTGFQQPCAVSMSTPQTAAVTHASDFMLITAIFAQRIEKVKLADFTLGGCHRPLRSWIGARSLHFDTAPPGLRCRPASNWS